MARFKPDLLFGSNLRSRQRQKRWRSTGWPIISRLVLLGALQAFIVGYVLHRQHAGMHETHAINPTLHWLRDSSLAVPMSILAIVVATLFARRVVSWFGFVSKPEGSRIIPRVFWALVASVSYALLSVPGVAIHGYLFGASHEGMSFIAHSSREAGTVLAVSYVLLLAIALAGGTLWRMTRELLRPSRIGVPIARVVTALGLAAITASSLIPVQPFAPAPAAAAIGCSTADRTYDVVAINLTIPYNRWGDVDPNGQMFVLRGDKSATENWSLPLNADPGADPANNRRLRPRPLVLRANEGECVKVIFTNELNLDGGNGLPINPRASMHVHGPSFDAQTSDGSAVGYNADTTVGRGESITYTWKSPSQEGLFFFHDHGGFAGAEGDGGSVGHGLFGAFVVEPAGSTWKDPVTGLDVYNRDSNGVYRRTNVESGDPYINADINPGSGSSFRETIQLSQDEIPGGLGFGFNYGAEPTRNRDARRCPDCLSEETALSSWPYGDPALIKLASGPGPWLPTPGDTNVETCGLPTSCWVSNVTHSYPGDPTKIRFGLAGVKETHVFHMHAHQWRADPQDSQSTIIDSQTFGPGEMFTADLMHGAGSLPGTVGDSIFHCHLYPHFAEGFWALFRVHDVREDGSGTTPDGIKVLNLMPLQGTAAPGDPTAANPGFPRFVPGEFGWRAPQPFGGISEDNGSPDNPATVAREDLQPSTRIVAGMPLDPLLLSDSDPREFALKQQLLLEEEVLTRGGTKVPKPGSPYVDPCPTGSREVTYNVAYIQLNLVYNSNGLHDPQGRILVLQEDVADVLSGAKKPEPLFFRANAGDCVNINMTNYLPNWFGNDAFLQLTQTNMAGQHIHLVQFDVMGSDGSSNGWNYQQAAFSIEQTQFNNNVAAGTANCDTSGCRLPNPAAWDYGSALNQPGQTIHERWYADKELGTVFTHDHHFPAIDQNRGLFGALIVEPNGMDFRNPQNGEYYQPINSASHGTPCGNACVGSADGVRMDIIGPGPKDDFREFALAFADFVPLFKADGTPLNPPPSPEVLPLEDPGVMAINYRTEPFSERQRKNGVDVDPAYTFSSSVWGDPATPTLHAYSRDPVRIRLISGSQEEQHVFTMHGIRWRDFPKSPNSPWVNSNAFGVSDAFNFEVPELVCGANDDCRGDYLYSSAPTDDLYLGMWGLMRVYGKGVSGLLALPDNTISGASQGSSPPGGQPSGSPPPVANSPGNPCPGGASLRQFHVVALQADIVYNTAGDHDPYGLMYALVLPGETPEQAVERAKLNPQPLVIRANEGDCLEVRLTNKITNAWLSHNGIQDGDPSLPTEPSAGTKAGLRVSLHPQLVKYDVRGSDGATVGYNRDQTVGPGESILYRWFADDVTPGELGAINLLDYGDVRGHRHHGLFAGLNIQPAGATYHDPLTGAAIESGAAADIRIPGAGNDFREFTVFFQDGLNLRTSSGEIIKDPEGHPPLPGEPVHGLDAEDQGEKGFNYANAPFRHRLGMEPIAGAPDGPALARVFSSQIHGDPKTPIFRAYAGDKVRMRILQGADKPRQHTFQQSGHAWNHHPDNPNSSLVATEGGISVGRALNLHLPSAGGSGASPGDYRYNCGLYFHHQSGGLWGITRVYAAPSSSAFTPSPLNPVDNPHQAGYHPIMPLEASIPAPDTTPPSVTAEPVGGAYPDAQSVTLTADEQATIYYTVDGTDPTTTSPTYSAAIAISASTTLKYFAVDTASNQSAIVEQVYTIGDGGSGTPVVTAPAHALPTTKLTTTAVPVVISWSATDSDGIAAYELQQSTGGGAFTNVALGSATAVSMSLNLTPGTYQFQVRAQDTLGNWSAFVPGPNFLVRAAQETDAAIVYTGAWTQANLSGAFGGKVKHANASGRRATFTFEGTSIAWVSTMAANRGKADVWLDGTKVATIDLYQSSQNTRKIVWDRDGLAPGSHTLEIRVLGTKRTAATGTRVDIDAFVALK